MTAESGLGDWAWSIRDEGQYQFMATKYGDRKRLSEEYEAKRKVADKSETIEGKPNPQYPRIRLEADMAQMRYEMAYILDKNKQLSEQVEALTWLYQRVDILEGAYGHMKLLAETTRIDYHAVKSMMQKLQPLIKEQADGKETGTGTKS